MAGCWEGGVESGDCGGGEFCSRQGVGGFESGIEWRKGDSSLMFSFCDAVDCPDIEKSSYTWKQDITMYSIANCLTPSSLNLGLKSMNTHSPSFISPYFVRSYRHHKACPGA